MVRTFAQLFLPKPDQWGLRGDIELWNEMEREFAQTPMPRSATELIGHIENSFKRITGEPLLGQEDFLVQGFDRSGISGGYVCRQFWIETLIPLILTRASICSTRTAE